ncbi:hypothetical protein B0J12DRAFT_773292 [Macrophomina phaseolina]|uniref:Uncharacterized protein n=1 Tax=Macrophomina phaseolina TaxID=35725 RepID=A0ABQ8FT10_9PEZI|nr:hypothetical protein B0J12DRAFT_773292 [Macrophomina phaseolina]
MVSQWDAPVSIQVNSSQCFHTLSSRNEGLSFLLGPCNQSPGTGASRTVPDILTNDSPRRTHAVAPTTKAPLWYNRLPMELRLIVYEYLLVSYPTGVRTPHFRITRSASGPQLARLDSWKYVKNDNIARVLYSHIFLGTYSQKRGIYHHHPGDRHPNDAELPVDKCIPLVERRENVRRMSARYNQRFDPRHAMMDIFRLVSHLSTIFSELEHVEFTISIKNWCLWLPVLQSGSVEDVEGWIRSLEEEAPKGLSVILQLGNKTPTYVDGWNSAGRELFERFDEEVINKALRKIFRASF